MTSNEQRPTVRFYTRPGCRLCTRIEPVLEELAEAGTIRLSRIDISTDSKLTREYGDRIPVVEIAGGPTFAGRVSGFRIRRALASLEEQ